MNALILTNEQVAQLEALNASGEPTRQLRPVPLTDGTFALNGDVESDAGPGGTWEHYSAFLATLARGEVSDGQIQTAQLN